MTKKMNGFLVVVGLQLACLAQAGAWDASRYIGLDELKPGMIGYGLTVFKDTRIERFEVELISVMRRYEPGRDAFLVMCRDERFDLARGTQGVSGSPVFFEGRLAGAMSFGWAFGEEPLYGVTPIGEMLEVKVTGDLPRQPAEAAAAGSFDKSIYTSMLRRQLLTSGQLAQVVAASGLGQPQAVQAGRFSLPLALGMAGLSDRTARRLSGYLPGLNVQGVSGGQGETAGPVKLEPGSSLVVPLIMGDINGAIVGTVTEVIGDSVWGFGHAWNGNGQVWYPMGTGTIHTFVNSQNMSFKLGSLLEVTGALTADEATAVFGKLGATAPTSAVHLALDWTYNQRVREFDFQVVREPRLTAIMAATGVLGALGYPGGLPARVALDYRIRMDFGALGTLDCENTSSGRADADIFEDILPVLLTVLNNPWQRAGLERLEMKLSVKDEETAGYLLAAQLNKLTFRPGETIQATVTLEQNYGPPRKVALELALPLSVKPGSYQVLAGGADVCLMQMAQVQPWLNNPVSAEGLMRTLRARMAIRRDRVNLMLALNDQSLALEGEPLPGLPASRVELLNDERRQVEAQLHQTLLSSSVPAGMVVVGDTSFTIEVLDRK